MSDATVSPPPEAGAGPAPAVPTAPSPLKVGVAFVKQYYKMLTTQPDQIVKFYIPNSSYLSHGEGSDPTNPQSLEGYNLSPERWGCGSDETMRFELEHGAIDAQPSVNDGILLVVTGQVIFKSSAKVAGAPAASPRKAFVHTFFLAKGGRNFAVHNDVLRFLQVPLAPSTAPATSTAGTATTSIATSTTMETADVGVETDPIGKVAVIEDTGIKEGGVANVDAPGAYVVVGDDEAPGGGVEESKEEPPEEEEDAAVVVEEVKAAEEPTKGKKNESGAKNEMSQQKQQPASKPVPGSWASVVFSGGSAPNTPSRKAPQTDKSEQAAEVTKPTIASTEKDTSLDVQESNAENGSNQNKNTSNTATTGSGNNVSSINKTDQQLQQRPKRDPDCTLVIKNLSDDVKEADMVTMFQPFAVQTRSRVVGANLNHHRALAFVDFDSVAPVMAALQKHAETPFEWNGRVLEIDQKTAEQRARKNVGFRNGGGGRDQFRRGGDRGGRRPGSRGGRGGRT